jgi:hypothetical protein
MNEHTVLIVVLAMITIFGFVGIWNNWIGHDPKAPYSSRAPFHKFYGYPIWNMIAFFSLGLMPYKSWEDEYNKKNRC